MKFAAKFSRGAAAVEDKVNSKRCRRWGLTQDWMRVSSDWEVEPEKGKIK